ncbi:N-acetyltransferase [Rhizobium sp. LjRoot30]|uniref:GNAT family N-acetyltransferase n=1 Tax=Rhizobium sp. LjRoot30 TaxID=3342320 RepID=UPI003ECEEFA1
MMIRTEGPDDAAAIDAVTRAAFTDHPHSDQTEHLIVERLRRSGALSVSLVAEEDGKILGHIAFSPVEIGDGISNWYGLGPVSVAPDRQGEGIGGALVRAGLERLSELGAGGCVVMGEPGYYGRFGFGHHHDLVLADCAPQYFMGLALSGPMACGIVRYNSAFYG